MSFNILYDKMGNTHKSSWLPTEEWQLSVRKALVWLFDLLVEPVAFVLESHFFAGKNGKQ